METEAPRGADRGVRVHPGLDSFCLSSGPAVQPVAVGPPNNLLCFSDPSYLRMVGIKPGLAQRTVVRSQLICVNCCWSTQHVHNKCWLLQKKHAQTSLTSKRKVSLLDLYPPDSCPASSFPYLLSSIKCTFSIQLRMHWTTKKTENGSEWLRQIGVHFPPSR